MKSINEIYGINTVKTSQKTHKTNDISQNIGKKSRNLKNINNPLIGMNVDPFGKTWENALGYMSPWQKKIAKRMIDENLIISVGPGAGKSSPFQVAFFGTQLDKYLSKVKNYDDLKNKIKLKEFPRLIYISPTRQLVGEFYKDMSLLLIQIILKYKKIFNLTLKYDHGNFSKETKNDIYILLKELVTLQEGSFSEKTLTSTSLNDKPTDKFVKVLLIGTYEGGVKGFLRYNNHFNFILIDELQEFLIKPGEVTVDEEGMKKIKNLMSLLKKVPDKSRVHLMTGTVNLNTLNQLAYVINDGTNLNFEIANITKTSKTVYSTARDIKVDTDNAQNRSDIIVVPYNKLNLMDEKVKVVKTAIMNKIPYNVMILFSVNRFRGIFKIIDEVVKSMPKRNHDSLFSDYKQVNKFTDKSNINAPTDEKNKWYEYFFQTSKDFIEKNPLPSSILDEYKIPNIKIRGDLTLKQINGTKYEGSLSRDQFFNSELNNYILINIESDEKNLYGELFEITSINSDYTIDCTYLGSNSKKGKQQSTYNIAPEKWELYNKDLLLNDFFQKQINDIIDSLQNEKKHRYKRTDEKKRGIRDVVVDDIEFLKYFDQDLLFNAKPKEQIDENELISKYNPDNLLYQGVLAGVGVMIGKLHNRHKEVIQSLFRQKKLYFLLATDSLGVGANVLCKKLYIPTLDKFNGAEFKGIDDSSMVQLVNRAGRKNSLIPQGYIYVDSKEFSRVKRFIESEPSSEIGELDIQFIDDISELL